MKKQRKVLGTDKTSNEHLLMLGAHGRKKVREAFGKLFESSSEPPEWQHRYVVAIARPSTKDTHELHQQRLLPLLSHFGKNYRQILARRLRVILRTKLKNTQALKYNEGCTYT